MQVSFEMSGQVHEIFSSVQTVLSKKSPIKAEQHIQHLCVREKNIHFRCVKVALESTLAPALIEKKNEYMTK